MKPGDEWITYQMADGSQIWGEYEFVTELEFFDDRSDEVVLLKHTWILRAVEPIVLPDPYSPDDDVENA